MLKKFILLIIFTLICTSCSININEEFKDVVKYTELNNGTYRGIKSYNGKAYQLDIIINQNNAQLKIYEQNPLTNNFYNDPLIWLDGNYRHISYEQKTTNSTIHEYHHDRFEFLKFHPGYNADAIKISTFNSDFIYTFNNALDIDKSEYVTLLKPIDNTEVIFLKPNSADISPYLDNLILKKIALYNN